VGLDCPAAWWGNLQGQLGNHSERARPAGVGLQQRLRAVEWQELSVRFLHHVSASWLPGSAYFRRQDTSVGGSLQQNSQACIV
jgi:hypothetical protein